MKAVRETNKKLKASKVLFFISLIGLVIGIVVFVLDLVGVVEGLVGPGLGIPIRISTAAVVVICWFMLMISMLLNISYRKSCAYPGKLSTFMYVMGWIFLLPIMIGIFVIMLISGVGGSSQLREVTITDEKGNVYHLTQTTIGSNEYRDQNGDYWKTYDGGKTFERVNVKATDDKGNEKNLTPTYESMLTKHYQDQDGEEWKSQDGGKTFEHVVTHATVKDTDGNEYSLRAVQAGLDNFIEQHVDMWTT